MWIFNERAARRSRSTSRFGCLSLYMFIYLLVPTCSWATQEQLQSAITMASVNRIDSNFFVWLRVCLLYVGDNMPRAPHARGHVHVPFFEGTCQNLIWGTLATLEQLQSQITMVTELRIGSNFFLWHRMCLGFYDLRAPCASGHVHVPFFECTCPKK